MPKYDVSINTSSAGTRGAKLVRENNKFTYTREDGESITKDFSLEHAGDGTVSVLIEGRSYRAIATANGQVIVNGQTFAVDVQDPRKFRGQGAAATGSGRQTIAAPMPGRVIRVLVEAGQDVEAGQGLIVVEAMKMQNEMKSPRDGRVTAIQVSEYDSVTAGTVLASIE
jgi:biotin carboxyl carrier protein